MALTATSYLGCPMLHTKSSARNCPEYPSLQGALKFCSESQFPIATKPKLFSRIQWDTEKVEAPLIPSFPHCKHQLLALNGFLDPLVDWEALELYAEKTIFPKNWQS